MSRRSSRKANTVPSYTEVDEITNSASAVKVERRSPTKKAWTTVSERVEITTKSIASEAADIKRRDKADTIDYSATGAVDAVVKVKTSPAKRRIKREAD